MSYEVIINNIDKAEWARYASAFGDYSIYQTWAYQQVRATMARQQLSRFIIKDNASLVVTMGQVRIKHCRLLGLKIGYVQWGPLMRCREGTLRCSAEAISLLRRAYLGLHVNVLRLAPNVYDNEVGRQVSQMFERAGFRYVPKVKPYHTILLSLHTSEEALRRDLRGKWRNQLRKTEKAGLEIREGTNNEYFSIFEAMYQSTIERKHFKGLDLKEFTRTQQALKDLEKMKLIVAYYDGKAGYGGVTSCLGDTAVLLLAAGNSLGRECDASNLTLWRAILSARRAGMKYFDLGGVDPVNNPGVYRFKKGLGGTESYHIGAFEACSNLRAKIMWEVAEKTYNLMKR